MKHGHEKVFNIFRKIFWEMRENFTDRKQMDFPEILLNMDLINKNDFVEKTLSETLKRKQK